MPREWRRRQDIEDAVAGMSEDDARQFRAKMAQMGRELALELHQLEEQSTKLAVRTALAHTRTHTHTHTHTHCHTHSHIHTTTTTTTPLLGRKALSVGAAAHRPLQTRATWARCWTGRASRRSRRRRPARSSKTLSSFLTKVRHAHVPADAHAHLYVRG
jgi:hypothetical protein